MRDLDDEFVILIPVFNDWAACGKLLNRLESVLASERLHAKVLIVDDGSTIDRDPNFPGLDTSIAIKLVQVLTLRRNLGHQRAIAIGLAFVEAKIDCETLLVMDCDGEDRPEDVPRLIEECRREGGTKIVFAERTKRSESLVFQGFYAIYKLIHVLLTGRGVRVGNFSAIPRARLESLVVVSDLWNHYAAAAFASRQPLTMIPTQRGTRLDGKSSMNFIRLVTHGLSAISVYVETVGVRLLVAVGVLSILTVLGLGATVAVKLFTNLAIPGWATTVFGILLILLFQAVMFMFVLSFIVLGGRNGLTFLPLRDYPHFVGRLETVHGQPVEERDDESL